MILSPKNLKFIPDKKTGSPKISVFSMKKVPNRVKGSNYGGKSSIQDSKPKSFFVKLFV